MVKKEILMHEARSIVSTMLYNNDNIKNTPIYRKLLQPIFSSLFEDSKVYQQDGILGSSLRFEADDKVVTLHPGCEEFLVSILLLKKGTFSTVKTLFDIRCKEHHALEKVSVDMTIVQNVVHERAGGFTIAVEEEHRYSLFNSFGLEQEREQETFMLPATLFVREVTPEIIYARDNIERFNSLVYDNIVPCSMRQRENFVLDVCSLSLSQDIELPVTLPVPIIVEAKLDAQSEDKIFFPYFHDADGFIITDPFMTNEKTRLSCTKIYGLDEKLMGRCHKMAMVKYLSQLGLNDGKKKEESQSLLLRYFSQEKL